MTRKRGAAAAATTTAPAQRPVGGGSFVRNRKTGELEQVAGTEPAPFGAPVEPAEPVDDDAQDEGGEIDTNVNDDAGKTGEQES